jgi:hypothetical protein
MHATSASRPAGEGLATGRTIGDLNTITITDANGGSQTLYFGADANNEIAVSMFDMPPVPPVGAFDARFVSTEGGTMVRTHGESIEAEMPISIQSGTYPVTVAWNVSVGEYELSDGSTTRPVRGQGSTRITDSETTRLTLSLTSNGNALPKEFALYQNYPNPFNPTTKIKYALPVESRVSAEMYNVLGQRVKTLIDSDQAAGVHVVEWNGTNDQSSPLSSGLYLLKISAEGKSGRSFTDVQKLMLLK